MKKGLTELVFIIDRSGSMSGLEEDTIGGFNAMLQEQQAVEGEAVLTTVLFDDRYEPLYNHVDIQSAAPLTCEDYTVRGSTALLDAIGMTIHNIKKIQRSTSEESRAEKVLFIIITDGHENASRHYTADMIRERIEHQKQKYNWEFIFFGANMDAIAEAAKIGIHANRARNYTADSLGTQSAYFTMSAMSSAFRSGGSFDDSTPMADLNRAATGMLHAAKANGGKLPDIKKIARILAGEVGLAMIYTTADLHGCWDKYQDLLHKINFGPEDTLYVLGDVIDRGPDGFKIMLDMAQRPNVINLMGNHEAMALDALACLLGAVQKDGELLLSEEDAEAVDLWFYNGGELSLADFLWLNEDQTQIVWDYMRNMPLYKELEVGGQHFVLVHGGLEGFSPSRPLSDYAPHEILWCRPEEDTAYYPDKTVIFGHTPVQLLNENAPAKIYQKENLIDIDCGYVFQDGRLACLCLDTMEEIYV